MSKVRSDVTTGAAVRLGDSTNAVWTLAELASYAQEGYDLLVRTTGCLWKKDTPAGLVPVASQGTYTLPTNLELIERLTYQRRRLFPITAYEAEVNYGMTYRTVTGQIIAYVMEGDGIGTIRFVRVPSAAGAASDVSIEYQYRGATLSADGTALELQDRYVKYVRHFVLWKAFERDGPGQDLNMSEHYHQRFADGLARIKRRKSAAQGERVVSFGGDRMGAQVPLPRLPWQYGVTVRSRG